MSRPVPEWHGKTDTTPCPTRVRTRIFLAQDGRCAITGHKFRPGDKMELDHKIALINGGENSESNLQWVLASAHKKKTAEDVKTKSKNARVRAKHFGTEKPKRSSFATSRSGKFKQKIGGEIVRRDA